ncbi:DUF1553 domain-containing protein [Luteolibacter arcticus]|uniref:DUF1553 domain-containing protein n=1 Tax=Luteolibacter arcticus TaxID=1581411 RepID=A0ABT3GLT4_9BACT|nr:DUF1553 domain-containing protein [Luteolibacter arcticus]MCW1924441.1 DUF1553 domain-containing protein [Luteolibacter arcticus]
MKRVVPFLVISAASASEAPLSYAFDVRPILSDRCFGCHGPDGDKGREAGLRLDTFEGATAKLESGERAIVPGDLKASAMVARIRSHDPEEIMPPAKLNRPLTDAERDVLVRWIEQGAVYERHWAFVAPKKHEPPAVKDAGWSKDDIDRFVLGKLEKEKLSPNPEADRATLLRRVSLNLTGLPPSPEQLQAYLADASPDAYEKQVDALLASPRYGERMAQDWLDVARFADTYGYQSDANCFVWPWRDWVIGAFNSNLSYDKFASWQVAGDLLPDATQEQKLATMFNRLHRQTQEGGSIEAEFRQENISDRVHTFGTAFLGLTMECSKCHDHKYDPLPQSDYYSMASMFGQIDENGLYPFSLSTSAPEPSMRLQKPHHGAEIAKRRTALEAAEKHLRELPASREAAFEAWFAAKPTISLTPRAGHYPLDAAAPLANLVPDRKPATVSGGQLKNVPGDAVEFDGDTELHLQGFAGVTRHDPLSVSLKIFSPDAKDRAVILQSGPAMFSQVADASGFELLLEKGKLRWSCIHLWPGCAASIETSEPFPVGKWVQVTVTYDGTSRAGGLKMYFDGKPAATAVVTDQLDKNITAGEFRLGARPRDDRGFAQGQIDELSVFRAELVAMEVDALASGSPDKIAEAARTGNAAAKDGLRDYYLRHVDPEMAAARTAVTAARKNLHDNYLDHIPLIMVMEESPVPKQHYILTRGDYASPDLTKPVQPSPPSAVMPFPADAPKNRLGLANWMTDPANPLVSRVAVNRFWMMCFGNGIVPTQENFGLQGDAPSHAALLDTLSHDFVASGWDVKKLLKRIVMSSTFRQSSSNTAEKLERDPANRLLARGPAYRLSGEAIRDQALFAAGLLVEKVGGPSVKPWQPPGVWSEAGASGGDYVPDKGEGLYRRTLYTFRKRTAPPPMLTTLDAGSREICQARRLTTNTPLQPLIFLNDQSFFECARKLAERCVAQAPGDAAAQCDRAFAILACRAPRPAERAAIAELHAAQRATYEKDRAAALSVAGKDDPSLAALVVVCSTLLTSDAVITNR